VFHQLQLMVCAMLARRYAARPVLEVDVDSDSRPA
jgi:hypothetical protein